MYMYMNEECFLHRGYVVGTKPFHCGGHNAVVFPGELSVWRVNV